MKKKLAATLMLAAVVGVGSLASTGALSAAPGNWPDSVHVLAGPGNWPDGGTLLAGPGNWPDAVSVLW
ncbi:MAG: hypothetical protein HIU81_04935 [Acidobacteria bacterium]|nr:hypothetical protein [Acidobacteriota bacterium]